jgi:hypothetical protein
VKQQTLFHQQQEDSADSDRLSEIVMMEFETVCCFRCVVWIDILFGNQHPSMCFTAGGCKQIKQATDRFLFWIGGQYWGKQEDWANSLFACRIQFRK